jgi:hypothetical protein
VYISLFPSPTVAPSCLLTASQQTNFFVYVHGIILIVLQEFQANVPKKAVHYFRNTGSIIGYECETSVN